MSKSVEVLTYHDLSFPSKFFYSDGIDHTIFPDETKQNPQVVNELGCCNIQKYVPLLDNKESDFIVMYPTLKILDTETALEAACGESKFLVS